MAPEGRAPGGTAGGWGAAAGPASPAPHRDPRPAAPAAPEQPVEETPAWVDVDPVESDLTTLTVVQLRERARAAGRTGYSRLSKAQLIAFLS